MEQQQTQTQKNANILQNEYLNNLRKNGIIVTIYLVNGIKLTGSIKAFDNYSILLTNGKEKILIFKHAISTITISKRGQ